MEAKRLNHKNKYNNKNPTAYRTTFSSGSVLSTASYKNNISQPANDF